MIRKFGELDGRSVDEAVIEDGDQRISILSYGCITRDWTVGEVPVVLGFDNFDAYLNHTRSHGIIAGRVANRTAKSRFQMDGQVYELVPNEGENHLHGGPVGLGKRLWDIEPDRANNAVRVSYHSPDKEMGYPGAVDFAVVISLRDGRLTYDMTGTPDRKTPINLAQHNYYNLNGRGDTLGHHMVLAASRYTQTDAALIPTGVILDVAGTHMDFREGAVFGDIDPDRVGIDDNVILDPHDGPTVTLRGDKTGLEMRLWTDQPAIQVHNAPNMAIAVPGSTGEKHAGFGGLCLEPQCHPDSLNHDAFPDIFATPEDPYHQVLTVEIR